MPRVALSRDTKAALWSSPKQLNEDIKMSDKDKKTISMDKLKSIGKMLAGTGYGIIKGRGIFALKKEGGMIKKYKQGGRVKK